jgi:hypothetical protein
MPLCPIVVRDFPVFRLTPLFSTPQSGKQCPILSQKGYVSALALVLNLLICNSKAKHCRQVETVLRWVRTAKYL